MRYDDRRAAGRLLAGRLEELRGRDVVVLGLPRGGVPVAAEVARRLGAPLDVLVVRKLGVPGQPELERRVRSYRQERAALPVTGRTAVVVDDGLATGATAEAACRVVRDQGAARIVLAVPVGASHSVARLRRVADDVVCPHTHRVLGSVGAWYRDFSQTSDEEVRELLARAARQHDTAGLQQDGSRSSAPAAKGHRR